MASDVLVKTSAASTAVGLYPWKKCSVCRSSTVTFKTQREFNRHLRDFHCSKEGGSFVCRYGPNGVCRSLPIEGVSDHDYEEHVIKAHASTTAGITLDKLTPVFCFHHCRFSTVT